MDSHRGLIHDSFPASEQKLLYPDTRLCSFFGKNPRETCSLDMWPS